MQDTPTILHAEDDDGHALLVRNGLKKAGFHNCLVRFRDGQEALDYFTGPDGIAVTSRVLMLDVRMPKFDGIEVLRRVRGISDFDAMPVIMLTTSDDPGEKQRCLQLGCNFYLVKPVDARLLHSALCNLAGFFSPQESGASAN